MIEIKNISKHYGDIIALNNVSFDVHRGEIIALLGKNGAGKSTLLKIMVGYLLPDAGTVKIFNKTYDTSRTKILDHIGYVPENSIIYPEMSVFEFLQLSANLRQMDKKDFYKKLNELSEVFEIKNVINQNIATLSKGYKKRIELVATLLYQPDILILDEPTEGLDPTQKDIMRTYLKEYGKKNVVIISTHILEEVKLVANRVIMLKQGEKIAEMDHSQLINSNLENLFR